MEKNCTQNILWVLDPRDPSFLHVMLTPAEKNLISMDDVAFFRILCDFVFRSVHWAGWKCRKLNFFNLNIFLPTKSPRLSVLPLVVAEPNFSTKWNFMIENRKLIRLKGAPERTSMWVIWFFSFLALSKELIKKPFARFSRDVLYCLKFSFAEKQQPNKKCSHNFF